MATNQQIAALLFKKISGTLSRDEQLLLEEWASASPANRMLLEEIEDEERLKEDAKLLHPEQWPLIQHRILQTIRDARREPLSVVPMNPPKRSWLGPRFRVAAVLLLLLTGAGLYYFFNNRPGLQEQEQASLIVSNDMLPGKEGAILTLADGSQIVLDDLQNGRITVQNGVPVTLNDGHLQYGQAIISPATGQVSYNTMSTPKGRQFHLLLPDGSKVWLNAASSIRYPTVFSGNSRVVEITGEAYFEVSKAEGMDFIVQTKGIHTRVLGTAFNINAYDNESDICVSLLEGKVSLSDSRRSQEKSYLLSPGQQALAATIPVVQGTTAEPIRIVKDADIDKAIAWKRGLFNFDDASLEEVMKQVARWYDIEVVYENGIPEIYFMGEMSRELSLSELLDGLAGAKVRFRIDPEAGKLIVLK